METRIELNDGVKYTQGDYLYIYKKNVGGWAVSALDSNKTEYGPILESIAEDPLQA